MVRLPRDYMLMEVAEVVAQRGTCERLQVGAVIARQSRIISTGYNGAPSGVSHCNHTAEEVAARKGCDRTIHAEMNAIAAAAKFGVSTIAATLYVTHMPCLACAKVIVNSGIMDVIYLHEYRITDGVELLREASIDVRRINPT